MFTGIVEERGTVVVSGDRLIVSANKVVWDSGAGASVAVNGVCLTVVERVAVGFADAQPATLVFDVSSETLSRTSLDRLQPGDPVNLERPVTLMTRLGGHLVQGHVDGVGRVVGIEPTATGVHMTFTLPPELRRYVVDKGSIAVDGVSLTVARVDDGRFGVALVPFTLEATTLGSAAMGDPVNLEVDVLAKYVEGLVGRTG